MFSHLPSIFFKFISPFQRLCMSCSPDGCGKYIPWICETFHLARPPTNWRVPHVKVKQIEIKEWIMHRGCRFDPVVNQKQGLSFSAHYSFVPPSDFCSYTILQCSPSPAALFQIVPDHVHTCCWPALRHSALAPSALPLRLFVWSCSSKSSAPNFKTCDEAGRRTHLCFLWCILFGFLLLRFEIYCILAIHQVWLNITAYQRENSRKNHWEKPCSGPWPSQLICWVYRKNHSAGHKFLDGDGKNKPRNKTRHQQELFWKRGRVVKASIKNKTAFGLHWN